MPTKCNPLIRAITQDCPVFLSLLVLPSVVPAGAEALGYRSQHEFRIINNPMKMLKF